MSGGLCGAYVVERRSPRIWDARISCIERRRGGGMSMLGGLSRRLSTAAMRADSQGPFCVSYTETKATEDEPELFSHSDSRAKSCIPCEFLLLRIDKMAAQTVTDRPHARAVSLPDMVCASETTCPTKVTSKVYHVLEARALTESRRRMQERASFLRTLGG
ncbi:hypothetical protein C8Q79DRAFT_923191 [Trametes meyenii]|nr:hypothetical protein C8Q79DRAFT_923191 [Trametes meyenii]